MGENERVECERSEMSAKEKGRRWDFFYRGIAEIEVLDILVCCILHPFTYAFAAKFPVFINWVGASACTIVEKMKGL